MSMGRRSQAMGRQAKGTIRIRLVSGGLAAWLVTALWCTVSAESAPEAGRPQQAGGPPPAAPAAASTSSLYERYRTVVERNIFSATARSPRPPVERQGPVEAPPPPAPGSGYVLTGVVAGGELPVALVEDTASGQTQVYQVGAETPAGRIEAIKVEGVLLARGDSQQLIQVGYTLAGEHSAKADSLVTVLASVPVAPAGGQGGGRTRGGGGPGGGGPGGGGPPGDTGGEAAGGPAPAASGGEAAAAPSAPQGPGGSGGSRGGGRRSGGGEAAAGAAAAPQNAQPAMSAQARDEVLRRLRERRNREMGGGGGG